MSMCSCVLYILHRKLRSCMYCAVHVQKVWQGTGKNLMLTNLLRKGRTEHPQQAQGEQRLGLLLLCKPAGLTLACPWCLDGNHWWPEQCTAYSALSAEHETCSPAAPAPTNDYVRRPSIYHLPCIFSSAFMIAKAAKNCSCLCLAAMAMRIKLPFGVSAGTTGRAQKPVHGSELLPM